MAQLVTANPNSLVPNFSLLGSGFQQGQQIGESMANRQALNQQAQAASQLAGTQARAQGGDEQALQDVAGTEFGADLQAYNAANSKEEIAEDLRENEELTRTSLNALSIDDPVQRRLFLERKRAKYTQEGLDTSNIDGALKLDDAALGQALTMQAQRGQSIADQYERQFPSVEAQTRQREATVAEDKEARLLAGTVAPIPQELIANLSEGVAGIASATFEAAGGGADGLKAVAKVLDTASEQERRNNSPALIAASFPNATKAETTQLQASMDAAKTTEAGLNEAKAVREGQRTTKKAQSFQRRGIQLLDGILANDQLGDVLGSIEGSIDFRFTDAESELIDDIDEVGSILTADNLNLMSGVLSESDIVILRQLAGGGLKRTRSEPRFRKDVQALRDKLGSNLVVTADDVENERNGTSDGSLTSASGIKFTVSEDN
jgi:hypothetical protein